MRRFINFKRVAALVLILAMCLSFTSCGLFGGGKIKNVVLIIGDGMGLEHIEAGESVYNKNYEFTEWDSVLSDTNSLDKDGLPENLTDSAASATAMATGTLTTNGYVGKDKDGNDLETILDYAKAEGKKTGILTTDKLYGATPAGFSAHSDSRDNSDEIVESQLVSGVDFLCGSLSAICSGKTEKIKENGYTYFDTLDKARNNIKADKMYGQLELEGDKKGDKAVLLKDAASVALDFLDNRKGFVLVIEQAHVDKRSHSNNFEEMAAMVNSLNDTVNTVVDWASERNDTAIIVTADHETGGLSVGKEGEFVSKYTTSDGRNISYSFATGEHTPANVGLFIWGTKFDFESLENKKSKDLIKNADVYFIIKEIMDKPKAE